MAKNIQDEDIGFRAEEGIINVDPGYSLTLSEGINGPIVITNGRGFSVNFPEHLGPCIITSFADHLDVVPLAGEQAEMDTF